MVLGYYLIIQWLPCCYNKIVLCIYVHGTPQQKRLQCYWASSYEVVIYSCYCLFDVNDVVVVVFVGVLVVEELLLYYCYVIMFMFGAHHNNI